MSFVIVSITEGRTRCKSNLFKAFVTFRYAELIREINVMKSPICDHLKCKCFPKRPEGTLERGMSKINTQSKIFMNSYD